MLTATGEEIKTPPVVWFRELKDPTAQMEDAAQLFLGQRIGCAKCHHHPFEKWSQEDYYGMTAFFSNVVVKLPTPPRRARRPKKGEPRLADAMGFGVALKRAGRRRQPAHGQAGQADRPGRARRWTWPARTRVGSWWTG